MGSVLFRATRKIVSNRLQQHFAPFEPALQPCLDTQPYDNADQQRQFSYPMPMSYTPHKEIRAKCCKQESDGRKQSMRS
jgi:hypothetical protein